jgi:aryl-alcohol dehydrogenase-like predicted oxidoreductase
MAAKCPAKAIAVWSERTVKRELIPVAKDLGLTVTAWSPLEGGVLTGKYAPGNAEVRGTQAK